MCYALTVVRPTILKKVVLVLYLVLSVVFQLSVLVKYVRNNMIVNSLLIPASIKFETLVL